MIVDSSVWIDVLGAKETPETGYLKASLTRRRIFTADLVLAEVLQGIRDERRFNFARGLLLGLDVVTVGGTETAVAAAQNYRALRSIGITIRKTIDTLLATHCILDRVPLLYSNRDFDPFVAHLGLQSAMRIAGAN